MGELSYPDPPLSDAEIVLHRFREPAIAAVVAACQDPEIVRFTRVPEPYGEAQARAFLEETERQRRAGLGIQFLAFRQQGGDLVASIDLHEIDSENRRASIGYWTAADARGRGIAPRAVRLLSRWALGELGLARVQIFADVVNERSQKVAERAGFQREGVLRSYSELDGRRFDSIVFSLLPGDLADVAD